MFEQTNSGPRAYGVIRDFYLAPMEQADISGITLYTFESQRERQIGQAASALYNLPESIQREAWEASKKDQKSSKL